MIGFIDTLYTPLGTVGRYRAITDVHFTVHRYTHTLRFSVFTSHILVTDFNTGTTAVSLNHTLEISLYCSTLQIFLFASQLNSLNSFIICNCELRNSQSNFLLPSSYPGRLASRNSADSNDLFRPIYNPSARTTQKTSSLLLRRRVHRRLFGCCLRIRCRGNVFTEQLLSNEHL
jgi:hypothetical protein